MYKQAITRVLLLLCALVFVLSVLLVETVSETRGFALEQAPAPLMSSSLEGPAAARPSQPDPEPSHFISPCDGYLSVHPITRESRFCVKRLNYSLEKLLRDPVLANRYENGLCLIFRLAPHNYHRYCYPDSGLAVKQVSIPGLLHSVRPAALKTRPVFLENARQYTVIDSQQFGLLVQMEVGALLVGKIHNHGDRLVAERGTEKGYFEFGGSTILILTERESWIWTSLS